MKCQSFPNKKKKNDFESPKWRLANCNLLNKRQKQNEKRVTLFSFFELVILFVAIFPNSTAIAFFHFSEKARYKPTNTTRSLTCVKSLYFGKFFDTLHVELGVVVSV